MGQLHGLIIIHGLALVVINLFNLVCNSTQLTTFISDNSTYRCVFNCPTNRYADRITSNNPTCRVSCLTNTYKDNSTGTGTCSSSCSLYPPRFADATGGMN